MNIEQLQELGKKYGLNIIEVDDDVLNHIDMDYTYFVDNSAICGNAMYVGFFDDEEKRTASVFHEIGHFLSGHYIYILPVKVSDLVIAEELMAWLLGFREAALQGIHFSVATLAWAVERVFTYSHEEKRES